MMRFAETSIAQLERFPLSVLQLLFRVSIAVVFWDAGVVKITSWQPTVALFANEYKVPLLPPELAATLAAAVELTCPVLLVFGQHVFMRYLIKECDHLGRLLALVAGRRMDRLALTARA